MFETLCPVLAILSPCIYRACNIEGEFKQGTWQSQSNVTEDPGTCGDIDEWSPLSFTTQPSTPGLSDCRTKGEFPFLMVRGAELVSLEVPAFENHSDLRLLFPKGIVMGHHFWGSVLCCAGVLPSWVVCTVIYRWKVLIRSGKGLLSGKVAVWLFW